MNNKEDSVLVAGFNTRPLAYSLNRAGFEVFAVDFFGDLDLYPYVKDCEIITEKLNSSYRLVKDNYSEYLPMLILELLENIEKALGEIRPYLLTDGGDISFVSVEDDIVNVKFHGACIGCTVNQMTLKNGVEATIKKYAPQIKKVVEVK